MVAIAMMFCVSPVLGADSTRYAPIYRMNRNYGRPRHSFLQHSAFQMLRHREPVATPKAAAPAPAPAAKPVTPAASTAPAAPASVTTQGNNQPIIIQPPAHKSESGWDLLLKYAPIFIVALILVVIGLLIWIFKEKCIRGVEICCEWTWRILIWPFRMLWRAFKFCFYPIKESCMECYTSCYDCFNPSQVKI
eukprot:TRINITY_DN53579_c0_g1_i1.p1 TRINITY_DN53579_c0_g1~~TRINITY_DN53579_c0_g1_i1.p1  ORF type:complete len:222 (-),score=9.10 TRINITY_DN53579_c0_g1_i1:46-621(-)